MYSRFQEHQRARLSDGQGHEQLRDYTTMKTEVIEDKRRVSEKRLGSLAAKSELTLAGTDMINKKLFSSGVDETSGAESRPET